MVIKIIPLRKDNIVSLLRIWAAIRKQKTILEVIREKNAIFISSVLNVQSRQMPNSGKDPKLLGKIFSCIYPGSQICDNKANIKRLFVLAFPGTNECHFCTEQVQLQETYEGRSSRLESAYGSQDQQQNWNSQR